MGNIGHKLSLIITQFIQFVGHIVERGGKVPHFIISVNRDIMFQITCCVFIGTHCDFFQRTVYTERKQSQNQKGKGKQDYKNNVNRSKNSLPFFNDFAHGDMNGYIPLCFQIIGNRNHRIDHFLIKIMIKITGFVIACTQSSGIEIIQNNSISRLIGNACIDQWNTIRVQNHDT